jgi:HEAT repeat protein
LARIAPGNPRVAAAVVAKLSNGLADANDQVRLESVDGLADLGPAAKSAVPPIEKTAKDDSSAEVRKAAKEALKRVRS